MVPRALADELRGIDPRSPEYVGRLARWTRAHSRRSRRAVLVAGPSGGGSRHVAAVIATSSPRYALDGIHLDYIRYPGRRLRLQPRRAGSSSRSSVRPRPRRRPSGATLTAREALRSAGVPTVVSGALAAFRRSRLTALVMRVRTAVKARAAAASWSARPCSRTLDAATAIRLQDWRTWLDQSLLDVICPMAYTTDARGVRSADHRGARRTTPATARSGPASAPTGCIRAQTLADTSPPPAGSAPRGMILFSYDAPDRAAQHAPRSLTELGRAAFGAGSY